MKREDHRTAKSVRIDAMGLVTRSGWVKALPLRDAYVALNACGIQGSSAKGQFWARASSFGVTESSRRASTPRNGIDLK
jgi:hypothetical protein